MKKLIVSVLAVAALAGGSAFAQGADSQAGSAYNNNAVDYGPAGGGAAYRDNSGWSADQAAAQANNYRYRGDRIHGRNSRDYYASRATRNDRDGDGVANRRDRFPDNPRRW